MLYESVVQPWLFRLDAERAHEEVSGALALLASIPGGAHALAALTGASETGWVTALGREFFGLRFPNPVGLAAGFDKDGRLVPILPALGFGFLEIGSVTLEPQPGNPKPRLFRIPESHALLNRMGFNSEGARAVARRLASQEKCKVPLGINLGLNKDTPPAQAPSAYARTFRILAAHGDYFVVNVSSPNTPGLRDLQKTAELAAILQEIQAANAAQKPVLIKLSPDQAPEDFDAAVAVADKFAQGLVVSNTTIAREGVDASWAAQAGGVSGAPLKDRADACLRRARARTKLPLIGVGGIASAEDARQRLDAGADLVQLYTGLVYGGPRAVREILIGLAREAPLFNGR
ncbi:MAG: quinone-dependent dihydroorotate dehydrogenase [Elusimicrobia bacterium]|nr:quinone-dependent dihydroorotate dehydrogenase [Elusimicrobiota bacterium]